jgi:hypothetical protein
MLVYVSFKNYSPTYLEYDCHKITSSSNTFAFKVVCLNRSYVWATQASLQSFYSSSLDKVKFSLSVLYLT